MKPIPVIRVKAYYFCEKYTDLGIFMKPLKYTLTFVLVVISLTLISGSFRKEPIPEDIIDPPSPFEIPEAHSNLFEQYLSFIEAELDTTNNVGAALAIVIGDKVDFMKTYGVKQAGTTDSVDIHTVFRLASVSKGFAGVLAAKLENEQMIDLDSKLTNYLPGLRFRQASFTNVLTIKHTLNQSTGLASHAFDNLIETDASMHEIISRFSEVEVAGKPGETYSYQNAIYSLIDTILRVNYDQTYAEMLDQKIFEPLGMVNASTDFETMINCGNFAMPHSGEGKAVKTLEPNNRYYNTVPAAGVNASISDMSIWLKALLGCYPSVIDSNVQRAIATPAIETPLKRHYTARWKGIEAKYYSLGWRIYKYKGYNIIYHGGYVKGYRAEISFCPELNTGIVFMQNSPNRLSSESVPVFWDLYFAQLEEATLAIK